MDVVSAAVTNPLKQDLFAVCSTSEFYPWLIWEESIKQVTERQTWGFYLTAKRKQSWWKWEQPPVYFLPKNSYSRVVFNYKCKSTFWLFLSRLWSDWIVLINTDIDFSLTLNLSAKQMESSPSLTWLSKDLINSPFQCQED